MRRLQLLLCCFLLTFTPGCFSSRAPVEPGTIPAQTEVTIEDEQYGQEVYAALSEQYKIDTDDAHVNRVRDIVDKLAATAGAGHNPWHANVFADRTIKNAAATRGNFIFVWSGLLEVVNSDAELATILAHEIGHVLAGHTAPDPAEETNRILAGILGTATGTVLASSTNFGGPLADLAELIVRTTVEAILVNPDTQDKELEADHIGLFLMAEAGYDPEEAVRFWERVKSLPEFSGSDLEFLSTHPSSEHRVEELQRHLTAAKERYLQGNKEPKIAKSTTATAPPSPARTTPRKTSRQNKSLARNQNEVWVVAEKESRVYESPIDSAPVVRELPYLSEVTARSLQGRWLEITDPVAGYMRSRELAPK